MEICELSPDKKEYGFREEWENAKMMAEGEGEMTEDFKKWVFKKAYGKACPTIIDLVDIEMLVMAMWAINLERKWSITMQYQRIFVDEIKIEIEHPHRTYDFKDFHNSEKEALTKALEYIYEHSKKDN